MLAALILGSLHGEATSKRYLSNQMPRTISTKPRYSVNFWKTRKMVAPERDAFDILGEMADFRYESPLPIGHSPSCTPTCAIFRASSNRPRPDR